jgi:hypothetical protein
MPKTSSNATGKQPKKRGGATGKGFDVNPQNINRKGRPPIPKDQRELNAIIDEIFGELIADAKGDKMDKLRVALNRLLLSKSPAGPIHILERRFGKVPQPIVGSGEDGEIVIRIGIDTDKL